MNIKSKITAIIHHLIFILLASIIIVPLLVVLFSSFKTSTQMIKGQYFNMPNPITFENYLDVIRKGNLIVAIKNSSLLVIITVFINSFIGSMVAYSISRFEFKLKKIYLLAFTIAMMLPGFITEVTRFGIIAKIGLYDTLFAVILLYISTDMIQIYIYKQFIDQIPKALDESAMLDGCNYFQIYFNIIFPLITPATATLAILKSIAILNDMFTPYLYMPSPKNATLTTMLMTYLGRGGSFAKLSAGVMIVMIPTIVLYLIFRKHIMAGVVSGAIKE